MRDSSELNSTTQDQLLKVIKFIRQEKDVAVTKFEILQSENTRLKTQLGLTTKQLEEAQEIIKKAAESASVSMSTSAKHAELLRKIETLNAVTDSNRILREERDKLKEQMVILKEDLGTAEAKLTPLSEEVKKLTERLDTLTTENQSVLMDAARWKHKANTLAERSNKTTPEDWRRLTTERENLAKQWQLEKNNSEKLEEEVRKLKQERASWVEKMNQIQKTLQVDAKEMDLLEECIRRLTDLIPLKQHHAKLTEELNAVKAQATKANEISSKLNLDLKKHEKTINDLKSKEVQVCYI